MCNAILAAIVVLFYVSIGIMHGTQGVLFLPFRERSKTNFQAARISFYAIYAFTTSNSSYHDSIRFHHLSYGLMSLLWFGPATRFGRWVVFDSCVNYDFLGAFPRSHRFEYLGHNKFEWIVLDEIFTDNPATGYSPTDGVLYDVGIQNGTRVFPADNCVSTHWTTFLRVMWFSTPSLLNKACTRTTYLINYAIKPYLEGNMTTTHEPELPLRIHVDFDLFKC